MPRVFFSYAHESDEHKDKVLALAHCLVGQGITVRLDQWAGPDRQDWGAWATGEILAADFIVMVASPSMRTAADGHELSDRRRGVQYEAAAIRDLLHRDRATWLPRLLPVVFPDGSVDDIPLFMQPYTADHYRLDTVDDTGTEELLRALTRQPRDVAPPLGAIPRLPPRPPPVLSTGPSWRPLSSPVTVLWRPDLAPVEPRHGTVEVHLVPVPATARCGVRRLEQLAPELAALLGLSRSGSSPSGSSGRAAWACTADGTPGLATTRDGQRSAWFPLPRPDEFGAVLDRGRLVDAIRAALALLAAIAVATPDRVAPAVAIDPIGVLRDGSVGRPGSALLLSAHDRLRLEPEDTIGAAELAGNPGEVADELAARLTGRVRELSGGAGG